jgi:hypothetical protein
LVFVEVILNYGSLTVPSEGFLVNVFKISVASEEPGAGHPLSIRGWEDPRHLLSLFILSITLRLSDIPAEFPIKKFVLFGKMQSK